MDVVRAVRAGALPAEGQRGYADGRRRVSVVHETRALAGAGGRRRQYG